MPENPELPDAKLPPLTAPEFVDPPPEWNEDDPISETQAAPPASVVEKITSATGDLFKKIGFKRGRGRPRAGGAPNSATLALGADPLDQPPAENDALPKNSNALDPKIVKQCVAKMGRAIAGFFDRKLEGKAFAATEDREFARELVKETTATAPELDALGEVTDILLKQMAVDTKHLPLICACTILAGAGARYAIAFKSLNQQVRARRQAQRDIDPTKMAGMAT